jgi:hypothetical protein
MVAPRTKNVIPTIFGGDVKLADINNIIAIHFDEIIRDDDKNYPACDKSVDVLFILEQEIL